MKRVFLDISMLVVMVSAVCSCTNLKDDVPTAFSVDTDRIIFPQEGSKGVVTVTSGTKWDVSSMPLWMHLHSISRTTVNPFTWDVSFDAAANDGYDREGVLAFNAGTEVFEIAVTQDGKKGKEAVINPPDGYVLAWHDEFDVDGKPSDDDWWYETGGGGWGNNEEQVYVAGSKNGIDLAYVSDGTLKIETRRIGSEIYSIRMNTKRSWQYGWFEARIKVSDVKGSWPALWMMPKNFRTWPGDGEIDIMEYAISTQGKDKSSSSIHCNAFNWPAGTQKTHVQPVRNAATEFHVYALEWTASEMKFYVDGNLHLTFKNDGKGYDHWPFDAPFYLKLNMAWGGSMGGKTDETMLPATSEIDYVRVFTRK